MAELFRTRGVVERIAIHLSIPDYLSLASVSNFTAKTLGESIDDGYFKDRLKRVLILINPKHSDDDLLADHHPTNVFDSIKTSNHPKKTVLLIYRQLKTFILKIRNLEELDIDDYELSELFGYGYQTIDQAKILQNIAKFIEMDNNDELFYNNQRDKIRKLIKNFTKLRFEEMQEQFILENYDNAYELVNVLTTLGEMDLIVEFFQQEYKFPIDFFPQTILDLQQNLIQDSLNDVINDLVQFFNDKIKIIDQAFGENLPIMLIYSENIINKDVINGFFKKECEQNIEVIPQIYLSLLNSFIPNLIDSRNAGGNFKSILINFINLYFEPLVVKFLNEEIKSFEDESINDIQFFENELKQQDKLDEDHIYKNIMTEFNTEDAQNKKFELLSSFTKIFSKANKDSNEIKFKLNFEIINKNLKNLKNFINFELCYKIIEKAKSKIEIFQIFNNSKHSIVDQSKINNLIEDLFIKLVSLISKYHIKPGFTKAMDFLNRYDPTEFKSLESIETSTTVEPLIKFTELINIGDLIQQMIDIFYNNELVQKKILSKDEFLNNSNQTKKQFEVQLDNFVANGLNIGIDKLMAEIEFLYNTIQLPNDFNPKPSTSSSSTTTHDNEPIISVGPTKCAQKVVNLLSNHINLLNGSTEMGIIDVFQQEIGERFFQIIVKNIKKRIISTSGSIILISDLNLYYDFIINTLKQKNITPLFIGLKEIGQLYLVSTQDSKELGKLIGDLSKFNGIFRQEEIYDFVQKRADWFKVKKDVEKAMYGLGITDCVIV
ncbi:Recyclin-1 [Wickerhamomyces ciferrii]|uniref:Recyclin-1 n=1 Tax=Wickerhamomyces ciferrii (strain ATCC 14091 / BCRC 22168 / CBS 111 / JCM 3599 / NBRC 0793 / NRRL Y-1031 F-60-10) TaxID=1206466 RepID=K0KLN8_WICCF|nr:Recyclin-1 [Wickerhamomyces ciferrii]CCH46180.1 Recyclin-1 [Wickerhamomyces ciferrii]